jgi:peptidyl-prolyl cis-trans isomerase SurA
MIAAFGCGPIPRRPDRVTRIPPTNVGDVSARSQKPEIKQTAAVLPPVTNADGKVAVRAIAYVNGQPIFDFELRDAMLQRMREVASLTETERDKRLKEIEAQELDKLIEREVIVEDCFSRLKKIKGKALEELQRAANREFDNWARQVKASTGVKSDEELYELLSTQGTSVDNIRRQLERGFISMEYMRNLVFPKVQSIPLADINDYYREHREEFTEQERVKWQVIFIDSSKFANKVAALDYAEQMIARLRSGDDFAGLAKKLNGSGVNPLLSSDGIGEKRGEIQPPELERVLFQLEAGQIGPPVELPGGYHIVRAIDRKKTGLKPLTVELQGEIRRKVQNALAEKEYRRLAEEMKSKAVVQILPKS